MILIFFLPNSFIAFRESDSYQSLKKFYMRFGSDQKKPLYLAKIQLFECFLETYVIK